MELPYDLNSNYIDIVWFFAQSRLWII